MTHYEILGVKKTATSDEIKNAYKKLVKKYHPDVYVGDKTFAEKKIKEINEAYDILSDPAQKREYDESITPQTTYTPQDYSSYDYNAPKYDYTSSNYSYKTSKRNAEARSSKYSYENYRKTYNSTNFGSYDYQKRYTNYHRSKTPNSNYSSASQTSPGFTETVVDKFLDFSNNGKITVMILIIIFFIIFFVINIFQITSLFGDSDYEAPKSTYSSQPSISYDPKFEENEVEDYSTSNPYLEPEEEPSTNSSSDSEFPSLEEFDINDVFSDAEILEAYNEYSGSQYATFEEFKEALRIAYYNAYILPFIYSF